MTDTSPTTAPSLTEMVDAVESTHHAYLHDEMATLSALAAKVASVHGDAHPELIEIRDTYDAFRADMEPHLFKEENVLFPMVRELAEATEAPTFHCGSLQNPITVMMREHEISDAQLARIRELSGGYTVPDDACDSYRSLFERLAHLDEDTTEHVRKENEELFPAALAAESAF